MTTCSIPSSCRKLSRNPSRGARHFVLALLVFSLPAAAIAQGAEGTPLTAPGLEITLRGLRTARTDVERLESARVLLSRQRVSSLQVKAMAQTIGNEDLRLEFAASAFPNTVDPENFYEVYDAFQTFSKVFRLHDRLTGRAAGPGMPPVTAPVALSAEDFGQLLRTVQSEAFDNTKLATARQLVVSARGRLSSRQVSELLRTFAFEDGRLELAKVAFDSVYDPWNYAVVYDTFTFPKTRELLAQYLQAHSRPAATPPRPR